VLQCVVGCCSVFVDDLYERKRRFVGLDHIYIYVCVCTYTHIYIYTHCNTPQHAPTPGSVAVASDDNTGKTMCCRSLQCVAALRCVAVCCRMLQCVVRCCCVSIDYLYEIKARFVELDLDASLLLGEQEMTDTGKSMCCSVLECWCVAVCFSVLQCCSDTGANLPDDNSVLECVAVCCSVLQCVAVRCSVLQCVAVYLILWMTDTGAILPDDNSVLQCVAMCCSVLQCVAVR